jgi:hypothetical protein
LREIKRLENQADHAEEIDLDFMLEDLPKTIDAMVMACDRLKNISTSLRTFSRTDKDVYYHQQKRGYWQCDKDMLLPALQL